MRNINTYKIFTAYTDISGTSFTNNFLKNGVEPLTGARIDVVDIEKVQSNHGLPFTGSPHFKNEEDTLEHVQLQTQNCFN